MPKPIKGRPSAYSDEIAKEICQNIASSSLGLKKLCETNSHWPAPDTIYSWLSKNIQFSEMYARAKKMQVEILVEEIIEIADDSSCDAVTRHDGSTITNKEHINRSRLRVDTRKWLASKLSPRIYGDYKYSDELGQASDELRNELRTLSKSLDAKYRKDY